MTIIISPAKKLTPTNNSLGVKTTKKPISDIKKVFSNILNVPFNNI